MTDGANDMIPAGATLHLWGPAAAEPEAFDRVVAAHRARNAGRPPELVVTPTHWGGRRRELLARALLRQGADADVTDIATRLLAAEPPVAAHTILVEPEPGRICVSRLDFGAGAGVEAGANDIATSSRLTHRTGDRLAIIADLTDELLADAGASDDAGRDAEYIVAGDDGIVAGLRRRGHLVFPVPEPELRRIDADSPAESRGVADIGSPVGESGGFADEDASMGGANPAAAPAIDVAELRRRARDAGEASASKKLRAPVGVAAGALLITAFVAIAAILGSGPAGPRDGAGDANGIAAAGIAEPGPAEEHTDGPAGGPTDAATDGTELRDNGIQVTLPTGWEIDAAARPDGLVAVNGGRMRILAIATAVPEGTPLETLAASIGALAAADPTADRVRRELIEGIDVVTHEERPGDGTVVLWQHRIVGPWQLSVGCQWRDPTIPQHRPICGQALRSAGVAGDA